MKQRNFLLVIAITSFAFFACQKSALHEADTSQLDKQLASSKGKGNAGNVFTLNNQVASNKVMAWNRQANGELTFHAAYETGGTGTGGGLGNQGALSFAMDNSIVLAVNPGSNTITSLKNNNGSLQWVSQISSGGTRPVSITAHEDWVYVLNAGGNGNIAGFMLSSDGMLTAIPGSVKPLSSNAAGAAQISFVADGAAVAITEKATNKIITYTIGADGKPGMMHMISSAHPTPFGFAVGKNGYIYVSEAAGGAAGASAVSSYHINSSGMISLVEGPVAAGQSAACWVVITNNGKYVYATNTGSNTVSSFTTDNTGELDVLAAIAAGTGTGSVPIDAALNNSSKFMYVLNSGNESIGVFAVNNDGSLSMIETQTGLPDGATGLIAK